MDLAEAGPLCPLLLPTVQHQLMEMWRAVNRSWQPETVLNGLYHLHTETGNQYQAGNFGTYIVIFQFLHYNWITSPCACLYLVGQGGGGDYVEKCLRKILKTLFFPFTVELLSWVHGFAFCNLTYFKAASL